jgi:FAD dependent oxidoreductase TIGR03364
VPLGADDLVGGALLEADVRVDPREAVPALADWLASQAGVRFLWSTPLTGLDPGGVRTSRGTVEARYTVVCVGHDVDRLFPGLAAEAEIERCALHMLAVAAPGGRRYPAAVLTGSSLLRYSGFAAQPSAAAVRARLEREAPALLSASVNLMFTQRPGGDLLVGDTHHYARTLESFRDEALDDLLLAEVGRLLGAGPLAVRQRWQGVYASAPGEFLVASPAAGVRVVSVTSGIGMTCAFGLAPEVLDDLLT